MLAPSSTTSESLTHQFSRVGSATFSELPVRFPLQSSRMPDGDLFTLLSVASSVFISMLQLQQGAVQVTIFVMYRMQSSRRMPWRF